MALDPSVITGVKPVQLESPLQAMTQAMTLKSLANRNQIEGQQIADDQATRAAIKNNMIVGPDGQPTVDRQGTLRDLYQQAPQKAMELQTNWRQQDMAQQAAQLKQMQDQTAMKAQLMMGVTDQASLTAAKQKALQLGLTNADKLPDQYDPKLIQSIQFNTLSYKEQLDQIAKQQDLAIRGQEVGVKSQDLALQRQKLYGGSGQGPAQPGPNQAAADPATLVPSRVPEAHQKKAFDEIEAAQNTAANAPKILEAFDNAAQKLHAADFVPGVDNADQKQLHALMGPTFKDVEGTVRQAAMDNMNKNTTPQFGDSRATIDAKRTALIGYLQSKAAAPVSKAYGIDLTQFPSTSINAKSANGGKGSTTASKESSAKKYSWEAK